MEFSAGQVRARTEEALAGMQEIKILGPTPAPLARADKQFRYQIMIRARQMIRISAKLAEMTQAVKLPDEVFLAVDIDPVNLF